MEKLTILLVEDHPATARLVQALLSGDLEHEFAITWAESLAEVEKRFMAEEAFDVVLSDLGLPDSQGVATLDRVLEMMPTSPVIVMTNLDDEEVALKAVKHGAQDFLIKGEFDSAHLKRSILYAVERKRVYAQLGDSGAIVDGVLNSARDAVTALEALRGKPGAIEDFSWLLANPATEQVLGLHARELLGRSFKETLPELAGGLLFGKLRAVVEDGAVLEEEMPFHRNGTEAWLQISAVKLRDGVAVTFADVTDRIRSTRAIQAREERLRKIMETAVDGIVTIDNEGNIESVNPAAERMFGYQENEVFGRPVSMLMPSFSQATKTRRGGAEITDRAAKMVGSLQEFEAQTKEGTVFSVEVAVGSLVLSKKQYYIGVVRDVTERKMSEARLKFLASRDPLTKLANRTLFRDRLDEALASADATNHKVGVLFLDLTSLKVVNDTLGHYAGDMVLEETARRLERCVRDTDTVARMSGDEFTLILDGIKGEDAAMAVAREVLDKLGHPFDIDGNIVYTSASIGGVLYPENGDSAESLLMNMDTVLHRAKKAGRNSIQFYTEELSLDALRRHAIDTGLRRALELGEMEVYYQPQIDLKTMRVTSAEALLRWNSKELGFVSPVEFIPVAEDTGQITEIGSWVLHTACRQMADWVEDGLPLDRIAVNLSAQQFRDPDLTAMVFNAMSESGIKPEMLEMELTESMLVEDAEEAIKALRALKGLGLMLTIDDFGTGYSSLSYLKRFPIDVLKIDRSFVKDIPANKEDEAIVKAIISLANTLGLSMVAEGIEEKEQVSFFQEQGVQLAQGFHYSRPISAAEFVEVVRKLNGDPVTPKGNLSLVKS